ncbi:hypothetical protein PR048_026202 [Dryococelus australis]|uniref:Uncharacterized protein n=1 Tax=Dryococelus australis TaxID=614101 RepID=A0ABQ9GKP2_9NEOP|nr:hypothetical protein PR048_026202 [Dryococelus australis]
MRYNCNLGTLRENVLSLLHKGHSGMIKTKLKAWQLPYIYIRVKICKTILRNIREEKTDFRNLLREYCSTSLPVMEFSPAQLLFSQRIRTKLPMSHTVLKPRLVIEALDS